MNESDAIDEHVKDLESFDAVAIAEELGKNRFIPRQEEQSLAFVMHVGHVQRTNAFAAATSDTHGSTTLRELEAILIREGFSEQVRVPFTDGERERYGEPREPYAEEYVIYATEDGLIVAAESYRGAETGTCNTIQLYFNIVTLNPDERFDLRCSSSSGTAWDLALGRPLSFMEREDLQKWARQGKPMLVSGHNDCRNFLVSKIRQLRKLGSPLRAWAEAPFLWFLNYMESKNSLDNDGYHETITKQKISAAKPLLQEICKVYMEKYGEIRKTILAESQIDLSGCSDEALDTLVVGRNNHPDWIDRFKAAHLPGAKIDGRPVSFLDGKPIISRSQYKKMYKRRMTETRYYRKNYNTPGKRNRRKEADRRWA